MRDENKEVISYGKEKTAVFISFFDKLYNPLTNADRDFYRSMKLKTGIWSKKLYQYQKPKWKGHLKLYAIDRLQEFVEYHQSY